MNDAVRAALAIDASSPDRDRTIDITTTGARSGLPRRIETWFYRVGGRIYLTGDPGRRGWYANLRANPSFTFHLKTASTADLAARATPVTAEDDAAASSPRSSAISPPGSRPGSEVVASPLVEVRFDSNLS